MANRKYIRPLHILQQELMDLEQAKSTPVKRKKRRRKKTKPSTSVRHAPISKGARH